MPELCRVTCRAHDQGYKADGRHEDRCRDEPAVAAEYNRPTTSWPGASPDGDVFDPTEYPQFNFVDFKCPSVQNFVDCKYVQMECGSPKLKCKDNCLSPGCDFVAWAQEDYLVQRTYMDPEVQRAIQEKLTICFSTHTWQNNCL